MPAAVLLFHFRHGAAAEARIMQHKPIGVCIDCE